MLKYGIRPSKRLGQNFMVDEHYISKIAKTVNGGTETVLEIGMGLGDLTSSIRNNVNWLITCDLDPKVRRVYSDMAAGWVNVDFISCDGRMPPPLRAVDSVVSNIPYAETSSIIIALLTKTSFKNAVLTLQKEVAERLMALPGTENYGRLSVMVQCAADVELIDVVPPTAFIPRPKVYSAIIKMNRKKECIDLGLLEKFTGGKVFTQPNKVLRKVVSHFYGKEAVQYIDIDKINKRVYELSPSEIAVIINALGGDRILYPLR